MKISIHPVLLFSSFLALAILTTGCPVGIAYPLCEESKVEKIDKNLLGTWESVSDSAEILEVSIVQKDNTTYSVKVLREGESYMADDTEFLSWTTKLDGHTFIFSQGVDSDNEDFYLYHYSFEGKNLILHDVGLLIDGLDGVTSTESYREEVSASLKDPECLTSRNEYKKK